MMTTGGNVVGGDGDDAPANLHQTFFHLYELIQIEKVEKVHKLKRNLELI